MKTVTVIAPQGRNNFHNMADIEIHVPDEAIARLDPEDEDSDLAVRLTGSQIRRIKRHFCPSRSNGCTCGSGVAIDLVDGYDYRRGGTIVVDASDIS